MVSVRMPNLASHSGAKRCGLQLNDRSILRAYARTSQNGLLRCRGLKIRSLALKTNSLRYPIRWYAPIPDTYRATHHGMQSVLGFFFWKAFFCCHDFTIPKLDETKGLGQTWLSGSWHVCDGIRLGNLTKLISRTDDIQLVYDTFYTSNFVDNSIDAVLNTCCSLGHFPQNWSKARWACLLLMEFAIRPCASVVIKKVVLLKLIL